MELRAIVLSVTAAALALLASACETTDTGPAQPGPARTAAAQAPAMPPAPTPVPVLSSAPLDTAAPLTRIAFGSCLGQNQAQDIWTAIMAADPDLFLFIGDNVYGDVKPDDPRFSDPDMPAMKAAYAKLAESEPFAALREAVPVLAIWDDHDYGVNDGGASYPLREASEALFEEVWDVPETEGRARRPGLYQAWTFGTRAGQRTQIIMLDTRYFRSDYLPADAVGLAGETVYAPDPGTGRTMLGETQWRWLQEQLLKPADLRLIISPIQVISEKKGREGWRLLPAERERLYDMIGSTGAENVVLLSGDRHAAALYRKDLTLAYPLYEMTSSSLNRPAGNPGAGGLEPAPDRLGEMYYDANFGLLEVDWEAETLSMQILDGTGAPVRTENISLWDLRPVY